MTNKQILKRAINKAIKNGWDKRGAEEVVIETETYEDLEKALKMPFPPIDIIYFITPKSKGGNRVEVDMINLIFDHSFAECFFGKEWKDGDTISVPMSEILAQENIKKWQHHLRQMVLKKEPLKYIEKFL